MANQLKENRLMAFRNYDVLWRKKVIPLRYKAIPERVYLPASLKCLAPGDDDPVRLRLKHHSFQQDSRRGCGGCMRCAFESTVRCCSICKVLQFGEPRFLEQTNIVNLANGLLDAQPQMEFLCIRCYHCQRLCRDGDDYVDNFGLDFSG